MFANPAAGDYSLKPGSPAIGAAKVDNALRPKIDAAGNPRPGPACDIGARQGRPK